jgi:hypothetical protein
MGRIESWCNVTSRNPAILNQSGMLSGAMIKSISSDA